MKKNKIVIHLANGEVIETNNAVEAFLTFELNEEENFEGKELKDLVGLGMDIYHKIYEDFKPYTLFDFLVNVGNEEGLLEETKEIGGSQMSYFYNEFAYNDNFEDILEQIRDYQKESKEEMELER